MAKILVVDDETVFVKIAQAKLEAKGYEVITAHDGEEGLDKAKKENPDLILLDILMPRMNGYAMLSEIRKNKYTKNIPVIMCSGKVVLEIAEDNLKPEADAFLTKPFDPSVYLAKIEELLKKSR